jgi:diguanylate cyclase (GGDEF)-like protein
MGWLLGGGLVAGGFLGAAATAVLPMAPSFDESWSIVNGALATVIGLATIALRRSLPLWAYRPLALYGVGAVSASILIIDSPEGDTELFYVYLLMFAFYFFSWGEAFGLLAITIAAYATVLVASDADYLATQILVLAGVLALTGVAFRLLRDRTTGLVKALRRSARTDPLTGLLNRRGLQEEVERDLAAVGQAGAYSVIVADLDNFKKVNDKLGHMGGDMTLERVTALISRTKRASDHSARLGGEEFAVALPGAGRGQAEAIAERLRGAIERDFMAGPVPITCTFGIALFPEHGRTLEELLVAADRALYAAKDFGKNRALVYDEALKGVLLNLAAEPSLDPQ